MDLATAIAEGRVTCEVVLKGQAGAAEVSATEDDACPVLMAGEHVSGHVVLATIDGDSSIELSGRRLSVRVESFCALDSDSVDGGASMRYGDSLPSRCGDLSIHDSPPACAAGRCAAVPFAFVAETDSPGVRVRASLRLSVLERTEDDRLSRILATPSSAGRVLRHMLTGNAQFTCDETETVVHVHEQSVVVARPLAADLDYVRIRPDAVLFSVQLRALSAVDVGDVRFLLGNGRAFAVRELRGREDSACVSRGGVLASVFEAVLLDRTCALGCVRARVTARVSESVRCELGDAPAIPKAPRTATVVFETDVDLSRTLAGATDALPPGVRITAALPPGAAVEHLAPFAVDVSAECARDACDLSVACASITHAAADAHASPVGAASSSNLCPSESAVVALDHDVALGRLAPGERACTRVRFVALRPGERHALPRIEVHDRVSRVRYELSRMPALHVSPRGA